MRTRPDADMERGRHGGSGLVPGHVTPTFADEEDVSTPDPWSPTAHLGLKSHAGRVALVVGEVTLGDAGTGRVVHPDRHAGRSGGGQVELTHALGEVGGRRPLAVAYQLGVDRTGRRAALHGDLLH